MKAEKGSGPSRAMRSRRASARRRREWLTWASVSRETVSMCLNLGSEVVTLRDRGVTGSDRGVTGDTQVVTHDGSGVTHGERRQRLAGTVPRGLGADASVIASAF